jgi:molybdopterin/thiamine biosynthesis adenylyltransferase
MTLTAIQLARYARQIILPEVGGRGQQRLSDARVLIIGCGGLGCPAAVALGGAGVGAITLVDDDRVALDNLHRQFGFADADVGRAKAEVLAEFLRARGAVAVEPVVARAEGALLDALVAAADLVLDGSDNFTTRFAVADACAAANTALVSGAVTGFAGQLLVQRAGGAPCYRCLFEAPPAEATNCSDAGVLPGATQVVGGMMAQLATSVLIGLKRVPTGVLMQGDLRRMTWRHLAVTARPDCACADGPAAR